jgi:HAD superfamily hydrolase (TIGR01662 family)
MVSNSFETKKKARQHIVNAMKVVQYMNPEEAGDYPERQREYKLEIRKAKQLLRKVYSPNNVIFDELDLNTHIGLMAALGTLNIGDEPFIDYKRNAKAVETFNAETFNADSKEEARLKKYEKTYGKEGAKVRNRIFKRIIAKADWGTKANQWSARKAQALTDEYEEAMKGKGKKAYKTSKRTKTQKSLKKWGDQKWKTKSGQDSSKTGERYLPEKAIKALTDKEYKKTSDKKRQDTKKGKQFSYQPKEVAKKVKKYRGETFEAEDNSFNWGDTGLEEHFVFVQFIPKRDRQMPTHVIYRDNPTETGMRKKTMCGIYLKGKNADFNVGWPNHLPLHPEHKSGGCKKCYEIMSNMLNKKSAETFDAESRPHSVDVSRSTNKEKKLMAVFEEKDGKKIKTTHFGARGMSDYTKHGDKDRMELYKSRHKKNEHWNRPMTAGSLSKNILWNKPSLAGSFNDYKRRFGLKGDLKVSRSAESYGAEGYTPEMEKARIMQNRYIPPNFKVERKDGRKYLFLDFDNTVRHTIPDPKPDEPKRRRPPHKAEEVLMIDGVKEKVHEWADAGYFVVGLTNQSNIESGYNTTQDVVDAIKRTLDLLDMQFPVYFASHKNKDLPDYNYRKPMTGMIDGAFRDFGSPNHTYSLMVGDDWEGADSGMAENAGVHFIGVLPFIETPLPQAEQSMFVYTKAGELVSILNPDDLIPTFAEEYDRKMNTFSAEDSYSKSATSHAGINMKMSMGTIVGVVGALVLGYNAPSLYNRYMKKETSEAESSVDTTQSLANQGFMEDWVGGDEGDDNLVSEGNQAVPPMVSYSYDPLATSDATSYDPLTRPPSMV